MLLQVVRGWTGCSGKEQEKEAYTIILMAPSPPCRETAMHSTNRVVTAGRQTGKQGQTKNAP